VSSFTFKTHNSPANYDFLFYAMANTPLRAASLLTRAGYLSIWQSIRGRQAVIGRITCVSSMATNAAGIQHQYIPNKYPDSEVLLATSAC
jgi:hypothetical protein